MKRKVISLAGWLDKLLDDFIKGKTQHLMNQGVTGSGKTTVLRFILDGFLEYRHYTNVWFDLGKSSEILVLAVGLSQGHPLNIILPRTMDIEIEAPGHDLDIKKSFIDHPEDCWKKIQKGRLNIICIEPFIRDPKIYTPVIARVFDELIELAHDYEIPIPLNVYVDEFNLICPAKGKALSKAHAEAGRKVKYNIERVRSLGIRFIASCQGWTEVMKGCREHFIWQIGLMGTVIPTGRVSRYQSIFDKLTPGRGIILYPDNSFSDVITFPFYGDGEDFGTVRYIGKLTTPDDRRYQEGWITISEFLHIEKRELPEEKPEPEETDIDLTELLDEAGEEFYRECDEDKGLAS